MFHAGSSLLKTTLLREELIAARDMIHQKLKTAHNVTVNLDGWTDKSKQSVYVCNIVFPDLTIAQWDCQKLSADANIADFLTGMLSVAEDGCNVFCCAILLAVSSACNAKSELCLNVQA